jgi:hypothetical protein
MFGNKSILMKKFFYILIFISQFANCQSFNSNIVAAWNLNENTGVTSTDLVNGYSLVFSNTNIPSWTNGKINYGIQINGTLSGGNSSYIYFNTTSNLTFGTSDFALSMWVKPNNTSGLWVPFNQLYPSGVLIECGANIFYVTFNNTTIMNAISYTFTPGNWYHLVLTRTGTTVNFYINNVLVSMVTNSTNLTSGSTPNIGFYPGEDLNGVVDIIQIWKGYGLTSSDVSYLWNGGNGREYPFINAASGFFNLLNGN